MVDRILNIRYILVRGIHGRKHNRDSGDSRNQRQSGTDGEADRSDYSRSDHRSSNTAGKLPTSSRHFSTECFQRIGSP